MEALTCDVCGGKLVMQAGKIAKCDYCGLEYSTESLREKIIEIKGTVNVQGIASAENILLRAEEFLKEGDINKAFEYYEKYLDLKPSDEVVRARMASINEEIARCKEKGALCKGTVINIKEYGIIIGLFAGVEVMIHISKMTPQRINSGAELKKMVSEGDELWCVCLGYDKLGRLLYSVKDAPAFDKNLQDNQKYRNYHESYLK